MTGQTLNEEQRRVVDRVMCGHNVFVSGKAGTGKAFNIQTECSPLKYGI